MSVSRIEGNTRAQQSWHVDKTDELPIGNLPKGEIEKVRPDMTMYFTDTIVTHPDTTPTQDSNDLGTSKSKQHNVEDFNAQYSTTQQPTSPQTGWSARDSYSSARLEDATSGAERTSTGLFGWIGNTLSNAVETVTDAFSSAATAAIEAAPSFHPVTNFVQSGMMDRVVNFVTGLWHTENLAERAFNNPNVETVEIPTINPDGTRNPFGGLRMTRDDYKELLRFHSDTNALLDYLVEQGDGGNVEFLMMTLIKALQEDKREDFDFLRQKLIHTNKERDVFSKQRTEESMKRIEHIKNNRWYEWFNTAATNTVLGFSGVTLGAATGHWGYAAGALMVTAGLGLANLYAEHWTERTLASGSATASNAIFGSDNYDELHKTHTDRWKMAHYAGMAVAALYSGLYNRGSMAEVGLKIFLGVSNISQTISQLRQLYIRDKSDRTQAQITFLTDNIREKERAITSTIKDLATAYSRYADGWKEGMAKLKAAMEASRQFMRNN